MLETAILSAGSIARCPCLLASALVAVAIWIGPGRDATVEAGDARDSAGPIRIDAIFVERAPAWWLVDDGVRRASAPEWVIDTRSAPELGSGGVRAVREALEAGEGGGYADETGLGPPPAPMKATACGISLVATARDIAAVFLRDGLDRARVVKATRLADSRRASFARVASPRGRLPSPEHDPPGALDAARRRALLGDATETRRLVGVARLRASPEDAASLDLLEAQALERTGRIREAAAALVRCADRLAAELRDRRGDAALITATADEVRRQAVRARGRAGDAIAPFDTTSALDAAIGRLPRLVCEGRTLDAVALVAHAIDHPTPSPIRSIARCRALLATTALALDAGDTARARTILREVSASPLPDDLEADFDALSARADAVTAARGAAPVR